MNVEQASKRVMWKPTRLYIGEGRRCQGRRTTRAPDGTTGVVTTACLYTWLWSNTGSPVGGQREVQPDSREGQAGPVGVAERPVLLKTPSNVGRGKGPWFTDGEESSNNEVTDR